jgi:hypothetical protein
MSDIARPRFRIHRVDPPVEMEETATNSHYRAFWEIDGKIFRVQVWSASQWARRGEEAPPTGARSLDGRGWMVLKPVDAR